MHDLNIRIIEQTKRVEVDKEALISQQNGLKDVNARLETARDDLRFAERELVNLQNRVSAAKQDLIQTDRSAELAREDIAIKRRAQDERDDALQRREQKVTHAEQIVEQNNDLMGL